MPNCVEENRSSHRRGDPAKPATTTLSRWLVDDDGARLVVRGRYAIKFDASKEPATTGFGAGNGLEQSSDSRSWTTCFAIKTI